MSKEIIGSSIIFLISFIFLFLFFYLFAFVKEKSNLTFLIEENVNFFEKNIYEESDMVAFNTIFKVKHNIAKYKKDSKVAISRISNMSIERNSSTRVIHVEYVNFSKKDIELYRPYEDYVLELNNYLERLIKREIMGIDGEVEYINERNDEIKEMLDIFESARFENFESLIKIISEKFNVIRVFDYIADVTDKDFYSIQNDTILINDVKFNSKEMFLFLVIILISLAISYLFLYYQRKKNINQS